MCHKTFPEFRFLGIKVHGLTRADLLSAIESVVSSGAENCIIGHHNLHSLYLLRRSREMRQFYAANHYTHVDGMSLVLLGRMMGHPLRRCHRNTSLDWFDGLLALARKNAWRLYFLGGTPEVSSRLPARLHQMCPGLEFRCHHGYDAFHPATSVYHEIDEFHPHIIFVGMGMPLQERWILTARHRVRTHLFMSSGGMMDYFVGAQPPPPRFFGRIGFEWLYRLVCNPRRLAPRYILEPLILSPRILSEVAARRLFTWK